MTIVVLVRHGETEGNVQQLWHGAMDAPLTRRGRLQVTATAAYVADCHRVQPIDQFYVSPLPRARSTAQAVAQAIGLEPQVEDDLREFDLGDWEGRSFRDLKETEDLWGRWTADPDFAPPNGESPRSFSLRAQSIVRSLADRHPGQTLLVVTHGGIICHVLAAWLGTGLGDWLRWEPHNCAITFLHTDGAGWCATRVNDVSHLPPEAVVAHETPAYSMP